jgi:hypothetical protein
MLENHFELEPLHTIFSRDSNICRSEFVDLGFCIMYRLEIVLLRLRSTGRAEELRPESPVKIKGPSCWVICSGTYPCLNLPSCESSDYGIESAIPQCSTRMCLPSQRGGSETLNGLSRPSRFHIYSLRNRRILSTAFLQQPSEDP